MSDPLSIATSLIALIQVTAKATEYLRDVKDGGKERMKLRDELRSVTCLLEMLHDRVEEQHGSDSEDALKPAAIASLAGPDGPLERMKATMEDIVSKLAPQAGLRRLAQPFKWPFDKKDVLELFATIERLKTHFTLVLQNDLWALSKLTSEKVDQITGAGKTRLASLVIDLIETQYTSPNNLLAYFYFDYNQRESQTQLEMVSSLLEQVLRQMSRSSLPEEVQSLYRKHVQKRTRPTVKQLSEVFKKLLSSRSNIFIVIDALDECAPSDELALELIQTIKDLGNNIRLLITSRTSTNFESWFEDAPRIDIAAQDQDVRLFLETKIPEQSRLAKHIRADPKLQDDIVRNIAESARGMFLLATLNLDSLSRKLTRRDVRSSLSILPKTLDATYEQALERIRTQAEEDVELAETVILWILCARRPLSVLELQHMYAVHLLTQDDDEELITLEDDDLPPGEIVTGVCGGLIVVDAASKTVRLVHYTAQDYLLRTHAEHLHEPRLELAKLSLNYLQLLNFSDGPILSDNIMAKRLDSFPFLEYAAKYWGSELYGVQIETSWGPIDRFLSNEVAVSVTSQVWSLPRHRYTFWSRGFPTDVPALVLAASFQLPEVLERLVNQGHDIEGSGSDKETPLIRSARLGHAANITTLLRLGAKITAADVAGETSIECATLAGNAPAVKALVDGGADVNTVTGTAGWSLLMSAVSSGSIETVRLLIEGGADLLTRTSWGETALSLATVSGQEAIANLLMDSGAILPLNRAGRRATLQASRKGLANLVSRLTSFSGDYEAVADAGIQREPVALGPELAQIAELDGEESDDPFNQPKQPLAMRSEDDFSLEVALEGVAYQRGFHRRYNLLEKLGKGHFAEVFLCSSKVTSVRHAVKILSFSRGDAIKAIGVNAEIKVLNKLRHPNILALIDTMVSDAMDQICLVLELAPEGELFNFIVVNKKLTQEESRSIFRQLFSALAYIHGEGWAHRDIKPENILMSSANSIKLADFGLAVNLRNLLDQMDDVLCGTPSYIAPEILENSCHRLYSYPVDVWSAGVVLYICLCGFPPFSDELYSKDFPYTLSQQIKSGRFDYPSPYWDPVGDSALDLIDSMLVVDPEKRFVVEQCLSHPWMLGIEGKNNLQDDSHPKEDE
ncbi:ankyrin [Diaporthe amygdali]|uniref:ankyrin n=1 Tax=Phomopsis amygdali TaxID=1214568 RepID=UPI0022FEA0B3|nr:ankyrin [Diaporthe amygdali]KAJ0106842.1 ankyrin [Diaporthe amygdali]